MTREEAISEWTFRRNHIKKWLDEYGEEPSIRHYVELIDMAIESLQVEAVQGEWEDKEVFNETDDDHIVDEWQSARCSVCGKYHTTPFMYYFDNFNYCPNC